MLTVVYLVSAFVSCFHQLLGFNKWGFITCDSVQVSHWDCCAFPNLYQGISKNEQLYYRVLSVFICRHFVL